MGYNIESKGFCLYDLVTRRVIINRDVAFAKNETMQSVNVDLPPYDDVPLYIIQCDNDEMDSPSSSPSSDLVPHVEGGFSSNVQEGQPASGVG